MYKKLSTNSWRPSHDCKRGGRRRAKPLILTKNGRLCLPCSPRFRTRSERTRNLHTASKNPPWVALSRGRDVIPSFPRKRESSGGLLHIRDATQSFQTASKERTSSNLRLLILSCSQKKHSSPSLLPALERYDGPAFRVINKFMRVCPFESQFLDIYILSAKFGLIPSSQLIPNYDHRMTLQKVRELQLPTLTELKKILVDKQYDELFISMGKDYLRVLVGYESLIPVNLKVVISTGVMGRKQADLRNWLHRGLLVPPDNHMAVIQQGKAYLRDVEISLTPNQVMDVARLAIVEEQNIPKYQVWYVQVDDQQVPPKWLVSKLTGLPVSAFHTNEARRVLQQLGVEVRSK